MNPEDKRWRARKRNPGLGWRWVLLVWLLGAAFPASAALQFDVFLGLDGVVPEASWFPVVCEIKNDGPSFTGTIEITGANNNQVRRLTVELPTGTLKRVVLPVFSSTRGYNSRWDVRLVDERGRLRGEQPSMLPRRQVARGVPFLGSLARTVGGTPVVRPLPTQQQQSQNELQPAVARLLPTLFPDNPLVLEGLACLYLNSERAADLNVGQVGALMAWLHAGGHLIVAVEQPADVSSSPWLKGLFPCEVKDLQAVARHPELQEWLRSNAWPTNLNYSVTGRRGRYGQLRWTDLQEAGADNPFAADKLPNDFDFEAAPMQVATGKVREGSIEVAAGDVPLVVTTTRGRGRVTALLFSPEREPMRSWKNLSTFWARLVEVPVSWYVAPDFARQDTLSSDGIFGAMIDTRQVHKLPVQWLLLLLLLYLVVIGPLDQFWLKKIGKPMLTWITFPCYVVLFSLVIYLIGYKLRAGESEWNDLHIVDVLPKGEAAELRGRTYSSVYAPSNQRYTLESREKYATLRSEFANLYSGQSTEKGTIEQVGDGFKADVFVPVWTSQLLVNDWWQSASMPLTVALRAQANGWELQVDNKLDCRLTNVHLVIEGHVHPVGDIGPKASKSLVVTRDQGQLIQEYVSARSQSFEGAVRNRQTALGSTERGQIADAANGAMAASFLGRSVPRQNYQANFIVPPGLDLGPALDRGNAVVLAWAPDHAPIKPVYQFTPRRSHRDTLWRIVVPMP